VSKAIAETPGVTLVEDDDIVFALSLCREIQRIYDSYRDGALQATNSVRRGLLLTLEMFAVLQSTVTAGVPAMRLAVGSAQVREMLAAPFGGELPSGMSAPPQTLSQRWRAFLDKLPLIFVLLATLVVMSLAAVVIVIPVVIIALFPNFVLALTATYVGIAVACRLRLRRRRSRRSPPCPG
jgi:hypothetical protein